MQIVINGEPYEAPLGVSIATLLTELRLQHQRLAIELNGDILPRGQWAERLVSAADQIEIVRAIGGG